MLNTDSSCDDINPSGLACLIIVSLRQLVISVRSSFLARPSTLRRRHPQHDAWTESVRAGIP